jgi:UDP-N-acetylmuramate: L-alanyl-gamma-D-glutamyl-meso-diaminopimelate ligase
LGKGLEFVVEGDEYDSAFFDKRAKFLNYCPNGVILGNVEFDHSDIYRDIQDVELAFRRLLSLIPKNGILVAYGDCERVRELANSASCPVVTFGCSDSNDWRAVDIGPSTRGMCFRVVVEGVNRGEFTLSQWGKYNVVNALGAMALSHYFGVSFETLGDALTEFKGVARRLEELGTVGEVTVVDDFAHHPTAIKESIVAVRGKYAERRVVAVFEPRSNTTVRNIFQVEIANALGEADKVFIGPIHRGDSIPPKDRLDISWILDILESSGIKAKHHNQFSDLLSDIRANIHAGDVVLFMSNGSFGGIARRLLADLSA